MSKEILFRFGILIGDSKVFHDGERVKGMAVMLWQRGQRR